MMTEKGGYIKISRNITNWRWWKNHNTLIVFLTILLNANYKDLDFEGRTIHRGQLVTSLPSLAKQCRISTQSVRTALLHLTSTGEITNKSYTRYRIITVVNYERYQESTGRSTVNQQTTNRQSTDNQQQVNTRNTRNTRKKDNKGVANAPAPPPGGKNGLPKERRDGTAEDIPEMYREQFKSYQEYWDWRNQ